MKHSDTSNNSAPNATLKPSQLLVFFVIVICVSPFLLNLLGFDFASSKIVSLKTDSNYVFHQLGGAIHHALLEWTAVSIALFTSIASFVHYKIKRNIGIPIIGLSILAAGFVDAFHTLAAMRIINANTPSEDFIPFTWALSRIFNAGIIILGSLFILWWQNKLKHKREPSDVNNKNLLII